jgi:hypothetical protein
VLDTCRWPFSTGNLAKFISKDNLDSEYKNGWDVRNVDDLHVDIGRKYLEIGEIVDRAKIFVELVVTGYASRAKSDKK